MRQFSRVCSSLMLRHSLPLRSSRELRDTIDMFPVGCLASLECFKLLQFSSHHSGSNYDHNVRVTKTQPSHSVEV